jgi:hypothetical protein
MDCNACYRLYVVILNDNTKRNLDYNNKKIVST